MSVTVYLKYNIWYSYIPQKFVANVLSFFTKPKMQCYGLRETVFDPHSTGNLHIHVKSEYTPNKKKKIWYCDILDLLSMKFVHPLVHTT